MKSNFGGINPLGRPLATRSVGGEVGRLHRVQLVDGVAGSGRRRRWTCAAARRLVGGDEERQRVVHRVVGAARRRRRRTAELLVVDAGHELIVEAAGAADLRLRLDALRRRLSRCSTPATDVL